MAAGPVRWKLKAAKREASLAKMAEAVSSKSGSMIGAAVCRNKLLSAEGLRERAFKLAFSNLVYPQIWEDPAVDLEALALDGNSRILTIASGDLFMIKKES